MEASRSAFVTKRPSIRILACVKCGVEITVENIGRVSDVDGLTVNGAHCKSCAIEVVQELKEGRFYENYRGKVIYCKDDKFFPEWFCLFYFRTIEHCRAFIDAKLKELEELQETLEYWKEKS